MVPLKECAAMQYEVFQTAAYSSLYNLVRSMIERILLSSSDLQQVRLLFECACLCCERFVAKGDNDALPKLIIKLSGKKP
jgi:hypothetical protein